MNICLLTMEWPPYGCGIGTYMYNLARGLNTLGHHVTVITHDKEPVSVEGITIVQVPVLDTRRTLWRKLQRWRWEPHHTWSQRAWRKFQELRKNYNWDIIETAEYGAWGRHFIGHLDIPIVIRCHNPAHVVWAVNKVINNGAGEFCRMPLWLSIQDRCERTQTFLASGIAAPSYALASHLSLQWVIPRSLFSIVPNPIDTSLFHPSETQRSNSQSEKRYILYVGRLEYNKGVFDLAESIKPLMKEYPDLTVQFIGLDRKVAAHLGNSGDMASDLIRSIIAYDCHERVVFNNHMPVSKLISFYQRATCTVMPTRGFESFSYTVVEAMACGCPVIATHCGGPTEIITNEIDGLLVPPGDTKTLTAALERLITSPQLCEKLGLEAKRTVERRFAISVVVPQIAKWYEAIIQNYKSKSL